MSSLVLAWYSRGFGRWLSLSGPGRRTKGCRARYDEVNFPGGFFFGFFPAIVEHRGAPVVILIEAKLADAGAVGVHREQIATLLPPPTRGTP